MAKKKFDLKIESKDVLQCAQSLLEEIKIQKRATEVELAAASGLNNRRIKSVLHERPTRLPLSIVGKIARFCQQEMEAKAEDVAAESLVRLYFDLASALFKELEAYGISPTEYAFRSNLEVNAAKQRKFSESCAGAYAIIRLTNDTRTPLAISPIRIFPKEKGKALCRFETAGLLQGNSRKEDVVRGYIYESADEYIHAVGGIKLKGHIRSTVLKRVAATNPPDLIGLRLSVSELDKGAFAYRLYCRRIGSANPSSAPKGWEPIFRSSHGLDAASLRAVEEKIPDIEKILRILREPHEETTKHWGVALPEGAIDSD